MSDSSRRATEWGLVAVALAALVPFAVSLTFGFVYDDHPIIELNQSLHGAAGLAHAWTSPYWPADFGTGDRSAGLFRPVVQFLYAVLWNVGGGRPPVFHAWTIALHVATSLGVAWLLMRALPRLPAIAGALLFAVHPVHVEAVANIVGSAEVLVTLLAIAACVVLLRASSPSSIGWRTALAFAAIYAAALGAKESAALIPALALLVWWGWRAPSDEGRAESILSLVRRGWRVWIASAIALAAMIAWRALVLGQLALGSSAVAPGIRGLVAHDRVVTMIDAWPLVGKLLVWPATLSMHYGPSLVPPRHALTAGGWVAILVVAALFASAALIARTDRRPLVALAWIALAWLPASNLLVATGQLLAERTMYLATVGVAMLIGWVGAALVEKARGARPVAFVLGAATLVMALLGLATTASDAMPWQSDYTLYVSGIAADPMEPRPYALLAQWNAERGKHERAAALFARAHALDPADPDLSVMLARQLVALRLGSRALLLLDSTRRAHPEMQGVATEYVATLSSTVSADAAIAAMREPDVATALGETRYGLMAIAFAAKGARDSVVASYREGVRADPRSGAMRFLLAQSLLDAGQPREAATTLSAASGAKDLPESSARVLQHRIALALDSLAHGGR